MCAKQLQSRIVSFDVAGTLLALQEEVGQTYSRLAARFGFDAEPEAVEASFRATFPLRDPLVCACGSSDADRLACERAWWKGVVRDAFGGAESFARFDEFFDATYEHFSHATAWRLFDDVLPVLGSLRNSGYKLSVISNFDSRVSGLLDELGIGSFFDGIFISSRLGAAKPDPAIFESALSRLSGEADQAVHVGDSWSDDVEGAMAAGMHAVWLDRHGTSVAPASGVLKIRTLLELLPLMGNSPLSARVSGDAV